MPYQLLRSLRFQIPATLVLLVLLFAGSAAFISAALQEQRNSTAILHLAGKLELTARDMASQAMNYKQNAPRDYATYYRDVKLYYQDLMQDMAVFDGISDAFMREDFQPDLTGLPETVYQGLNAHTRMATQQVEEVWADFKRDLLQALGAEVDEPLLERAAEYIIANHQSLDDATTSLQEAFRKQVDIHLKLIKRTNTLALAAIVAFALLAVFWFYRTVLRPLDTAVRGFRKVAQGDFGLQVEVGSNQEFAWLANSFNHLSRRLHAIFQLLDRLQEGSNLDQTLQFVTEEFSSLLPLDWVGILFVMGDQASIKLDRSYSNGQVEIAIRTFFPLQGTLLQEALDAGTPLHIPDIPATSRSNRNYRFLRVLAERGMQDCIFLPFAAQSPTPGVLVFATKQTGAYTAEHLELLSNIAHLVTHSFGRTVRLAERVHLAAIGEFASGIAHEMRSPLATVRLALDHLRKLGLAENSAKRVALAIQENERMARLLEDMLIYAKPVKLELRALDLTQVLRDILRNQAELFQEKNQRFDLTCDAGPQHIFGDPDRLTQIIVNLTRNACEAAPERTKIRYRVHADRVAETVTVDVSNPGPTIPSDVQSRLFEPFFTTKASGTGLGLGIVKRLTEAHGGEINVQSDAAKGTSVTVSFPAATTGVKQRLP